MDFENEKWKIVYRHPSAWIALFLVIIHQCFVAGSTIFLTDVIERFQSGREYALYLYLYLAAMAIPYLPGCLSFVFLQRWINESHLSFTDSILSKMAGSIGKYRSEVLRERVTAVLSRNSFSVLKDYITFVHDLASFSLNSALSMAVIAFLLPARLLGGYAISLVLCFLIVAGLRKLIAATSSKYENDYLTYSGMLDKGWENNTIGNRYNEAIWREQKELTGKAFYSTSSRLQVYKQIGNILLAAASLLPTIFLIVTIVHDRTASAQVIAAVIVSLTRIFLIINSLSALVYKVLDFSSMRARLNVLFDTGEMMSEELDEVPGKVGNVMINGMPAGSTERIVKMLSSAGPGRFEITGANGSGKSTVLLKLKEIYGDECFLLPAHHADLMWKSNGAMLSTGQRISVYLDEIFGIKGLKYIFLDEWDANLDGVNTKTIDASLDQLAKTRTIVEVRHLRSRP